MYLKSAYPTAPCPCVLSLTKELVEKRFVRGFSAIFQSFCHKKKECRFVYDTPCSFQL
ncbi:hypothetical protein PORCAN_991 [Porphyromonas crevioricanis JCM 13913]|nr:hypothetical protein PORCAN_991 [Porphyromonas crevioricanis JCM 13913]